MQIENKFIVCFTCYRRLPVAYSTCICTSPLVCCPQYWWCVHFETASSVEHFFFFQWHMAPWTSLSYSIHKANANIFRFELNTPISMRCVRCAQVPIFIDSFHTQFKIVRQLPIYPLEQITYHHIFSNSFYSIVSLDWFDLDMVTRHEFTFLCTFLKMFYRLGKWCSVWKLFTFSTITKFPDRNK